MPDPTPGEVCYDAWVRASARWRRLPWRHLTPEKQATWEAAAQAVLARQEALRARHPLTEGAVVRALTRLERGWPQD